jgi:hypothetical protein
MHDNKIKELLQAQKEKKKVIGYKQNLLLTNFPYLYHMSLKLLLMEKKMKSHTSLSLSLSSSFPTATHGNQCCDSM